jgi:hypothetical protein
MQTAQDGFVNINIDVCERDLFNLIRQFPADDFSSSCTRTAWPRSAVRAAMRNMFLSQARPIDAAL